MITSFVALSIAHTGLVYQPCTSGCVVLHNKSLVEGFFFLVEKKLSQQNDNLLLSAFPCPGIATANQ